MMLPEPVPVDAVALVDADDQIVGFEWGAMPEVRKVEIRRRSPQEVRARLLDPPSPLPRDLAQALADEMTPEGQ